MTLLCSELGASKFRFLFPRLTLPDCGVEAGQSAIASQFANESVGLGGTASAPRKRSEVIYISSGGLTDCG